MAELPFFPLSTDAFLADCAHLTDAETGCYFQILIALWRAPHQRLPNDDEWLARKFRRSVERVGTELRPLFGEFCQNDGNWITQKRISKEYKRAARTVSQRRDAANARWAKEKIACERNTGSHAFRNAPTPTLIPIQEDMKESPPLASLGHPPTGATPAKRGKRLPDDWKPTADDRAFAADLGLDPDVTADEFRDYWTALPGARGRKLDWSKTWRNRCRELGKHPRPNGNGTHETADQRRIRLGLAAIQRATPK